MKRFLRWIAKIFGSALTIILVIVFFPYISKLAARVLPDESGAAIKASAILATRLDNSARLETLKVEEEGVLNYDINAAFIGTVGNVNVSYVYAASFGIDLSKVIMKVEGDSITFILPQYELLQDSLTPHEVYRNDFWTPGFTDADYAELLEGERIARRAVYLSGENEHLLQEATVEAFEKTIAAWMKEFDANLSFHYEMTDNAEIN